MRIVELHTDADIEAMCRAQGRTLEKPKQGELKCHSLKK
jgi:hypothetical protein